MEQRKNPGVGTVGAGGVGGGVTPLNKLYRYVWHQKVQYIYVFQAVLV